MNHVVSHKKRVARSRYVMITRRYTNPRRASMCVTCCPSADRGENEIYGREYDGIGMGVGACSLLLTRRLTGLSLAVGWWYVGGSVGQSQCLCRSRQGRLTAVHASWAVGEKCVVANRGMMENIERQLNGNGCNMSRGCRSNGRGMRGGVTARPGGVRPQVGMVAVVLREW